MSSPALSTSERIRPFPSRTTFCWVMR